MIKFKKSDEIKRYKILKNTKENKTKRVLTCVLKVVFRLMVLVMLLVVLAVYAVCSVCSTVAKGPSETVRNMLVLTATQASATKWVPGLFLDEKTVEDIKNQSNVLTVEEVDFEDINVPNNSGDTNGGNTEEKDEWEGNEDGIICYTTSTGTFKAYVMIIKDPSRVYTETSGYNYSTATRGARIYERAKQLNVAAAINGGEFYDKGGSGSGGQPMGLTYSQGTCVWNDGLKRTFIGIDKDNNLVVKEGMTKAEADALGVRDGVSFQTGNVLIDTVNGSTVTYSGNGNIGVAQRTAIGQREDGAIIFIVTDGRTTSSLGATRDDIITLMLQNKAIKAGMLDGGSSSMMYYRDYIEKYDIDTSTLDEYQKLGLVNRYKAFTYPRRLPTFFMVKDVT